MYPSSQLSAIGVPQTRERIPTPSYRHAMPSGPWPWMDLDSQETENQSVELSCPHPSCTICPQWLHYPQSLFPNWTHDQVGRSAMMIKSGQSTNCRIYFVDVNSHDGSFEGPTEISVKGDERDLWASLHEPRPPGLRARAFFVENITSPVLKMLGSIYTIEPFFFSSSLNWIPSRYQENAWEAKGDHITITLTFLRPARVGSPIARNAVRTSFSKESDDEDRPVIDTQAPLPLRSETDEKILVLDTLAIHVIRKIEDSTIISYHPNPEGSFTSSCGLHARFRLAGKSVYWQEICKKSKDPTFLLLINLWHAVYAWDEALGMLYTHICYLEGVMNKQHISITRESHVIRAHLLHHASLLDDFRKSVHFILETRNPAMSSCSEDVKTGESEYLKRECDHLFSEIGRLEMYRLMQDRRLQNVIDLTFSLVNLEDSKETQKLMEATIKDSEAMKVVSYLTMLFLPAIFVSGIFGMNIKEISPGTKFTVREYVVTVVLITSVTVYVMVAFQVKYSASGREKWMGFLWPMTFLSRMLGKSG